MFGLWVLGACLLFSVVWFVGDWIFVNGLLGICSLYSGCSPLAGVLVVVRLL